jgi:hypothetical protein
MPLQELPPAAVNSRSSRTSRSSNFDSVHYYITLYYKEITLFFVTFDNYVSTCSVANCLLSSKLTPFLIFLQFTYIYNFAIDSFFKFVKL